MTKIKEIKQRFEILDDLKEIMTAMKSIAYMETKKLSAFSANQGRMVASIKEVAADFLAFYPLSEPETSSSLIVAVGSERGLCGNFNQQVLEAVKGELGLADEQHRAIIAVGGRLAMKLQNSVALTSSVKGASFADEIPSVLTQLFDVIGKLSDENGGKFMRVKIIANATGDEEISVTEPLENLKQEACRYGNPPALTLEPHRFFEGLLRCYLQSMLSQIFYSSLLAENVKRIRHLDGAVDRLERNACELRLRYNQARQEDITEEIEILMMTAKSYPA